MLQIRQTMLRAKRGKTIPRGENTKGKEMPKIERNSQKNDNESPLIKQLREEKRKNSKLQVKNF